MWSCKKCGSLWTSAIAECNCKVFVIDFAGETFDMHAMDFEHAALRWAQFWDGYNSRLLNKAVSIIIGDVHDEVRIFTVSAQPDVRYSADEKAA